MSSDARIGDSKPPWTKDTCVREVVRAWEKFQSSRDIGEPVDDVAIVEWHSTLQPELKFALRAARLEKRFLDETIDVQCPECDSSQDVPLKKSRRPVSCPVCECSFTPERWNSRSRANRVHRDVEESSGDSIGKYELQTILGRGSFGRVWKARDTTLRRDVALKISHESDGRYRDRFFREAEAIAALNHPGIVPVYESGETDGQLWISLQYVNSQTLLQVLRASGGVLPARRVAELGVRVAKALAHAHSNNVIHRDIKPQNILIDTDGEPHIVDFGLAKMLDRSNLSNTGDTLGTLTYMAPEQVGGRSPSPNLLSGNDDEESQELNGRADLYSLGAVLYELLTGRPPFEATNAAGVIQQILDVIPIAPKQKNVAVPDDLDQICLKCLHKNELDRYESADALADDLQRFLENRPVHARPLSPVRRARRWCHRNPKRARAYFGASMTVLLAIVVSFLLINDARLIAETERDTSERRRVETLTWLGVAQDSLGMSLQLGRTFEPFPEMRAAYTTFLEQAARNYQLLSDRKSDDPELELHRGQVWLILSDIRRDLGDTVAARQACENARDILEAVYRQRPGHLPRAELANVLGRMASLAILDRDPETAMELSQKSLTELEAVRRDDPQSQYISFSLAAAHLNHGSLLLEVTRPEEAATSLTEAATVFVSLVRANPEDSSFAAGLANTLTLLGRAASGVGDHSAAVQQISSGLAVLANYSKTNGTDTFLLMSRAAGHADLAAVLDAAGRTDEGLTEWEFSVQTWGSLADQSPDVIRYYEQFVMREIDCGQALYDAGRTQRAMPYLSDAQQRIDEELQHVPDDVVWLNIRGLCLDAMARVEADLGNADVALELTTRARADFDKASNFAPDDPEARFRSALVRNHHGQNLSRLGEPAEGVKSIVAAEAILTDFATDYADWSRLHFALEQAAFCARERGVILFEMGKTEESNEAFQTAVERWETLVEAHDLPRFRNNLAWCLIEVPDRRIRDTERAISLAKGLCQDVPSNPAYDALLGAALSVSGNDAEAVKILTRVTTQNPDRRARDWLYLAQSLARMNRLTDAQDCFRKGAEWMDREMPAEPWLGRLRQEVANAVSQEP